MIVGADRDIPASDSRSRTGSTPRFIHFSLSRIRPMVRYYPSKMQGVGRIWASCVPTVDYTSEVLIPTDVLGTLTVIYPTSDRREGSETPPGGWRRGMAVTNRPMSTNEPTSNKPGARVVRRRHSIPALRPLPLWARKGFNSGWQRITHAVSPPHPSGFTGQVGRGGAACVTGITTTHDNTQFRHSNRR